MSEIKLSFCIPVMNRLNDIQATLRRNLDDNFEDVDSVEFVLIAFDHGFETKKWVNENFQKELNSGYLKFFNSTSLKTWHFGKAKNSFKKLFKGKIYSSLDGDNYTGYRGGRHIIDVFERFSYACIFHQFQGDWGDGTCGRISMCRDDYINFGYNEDFLPRQWDELDAMLTALVHNKGLKYVSYSGKSIFSKSFPFRRFFEENHIFVEKYEISSDLDPLYSRLNESAPAEGKHNSNYVQDDPILKYSSIYNHLTSYINNVKNDDLLQSYILEITEMSRKMVEEIPPDTLLRLFLNQHDERQIIVKPTDVVLISTIKNETNLAEWYRYYTEIGVDKFLIIDDFSTEKISSILAHDNVFVFSPICGKFKYAKAFWMEILLANYCNGNWCLTVDSDEFIGLPIAYIQACRNRGINPLLTLFDKCNMDGRNYLVGFLLDMILDPNVSSSDFGDLNFSFKDFTNFQYRPLIDNKAYRNHNTVKWSYGGFSDWAYKIDVRFRLNGSLDSLRKFPALLYKKGMHLNQGFHDLIIDGIKRKSTDLDRVDLLPIRHYKFFSSQMDSKFIKNRIVNQYHKETAVNLNRLRSRLPNLLKFSRALPFSFKYIDFFSVPTPSSSPLKFTSYETLSAFEAADPLRLVYLRNTISFIIFNSDPLFKDGILYARNENDARRWISENTPLLVE